MSSTVDFEDIDIVGRDEHPVTESVKLNGSPGTGKTTQIFRRYIEALDELDVDVGDTCVASYRVDLANSLLRKLNSLGVISDYELSESGGRTQWFGTIHGICRRLIGEDLEMVQPRHRAKWCSNRNWKYNSSEDEGKPVGKLFFEVVDWLTINQETSENACVAPSYDEFVNKFRPIDFEGPAEDWLEYKKREGLYDFSDLLSIVISDELAPDVDILVIDEMHDVYPLMNSVIQMWVDSVREDGGVVLVAGDTQQVINQYQGASSEFFDSLELPEISLTECHKRPPKYHWDLARSVLSKSHSPRDISVDVEGSVSVVQSPELPAVGKNTPQDILEVDIDDDDSTMFLARTQSQCRDIAKSLRSRGVLFNGSNGTLAWTRRESHERVAIYHILQLLSNFSEEDVETEGWVEDDIEFVDDYNIDIRTDDLRYFFDVLPDRYVFYEREDIDEDLREYDKWNIDYLAKYTTKQFWSELTRGSDSVEYLSVGSGLKSWLVPALDRNNRSLYSSENIRVTVQTIHASKGSEADVVVLYDGITTRIQEAIYQSKESRKNEHRVWYVALTRSKSDLVIVPNAFQYTEPYLTQITGDKL